jgi:hypothetical protein
MAPPPRLNWPDWRLMSPTQIHSAPAAAVHASETAHLLWSFSLSQRVSGENCSGRFTG